jgi:hypothetical protein
LFLTIIAVAKKKERAVASPARSLSLAGLFEAALKLQQHVDSDEAPSISASYTRTTGSLATTKVRRLPCRN